MVGVDTMRLQRARLCIWRTLPTLTLLLVVSLFNWNMHVHCIMETQLLFEAEQCGLEVSYGTGSGRCCTGVQHVLFPWHDAEYLTWLTNAVVKLHMGESIGQMNMLTCVN